MNAVIITDPERGSFDPECEIYGGVVAADFNNLCLLAKFAMCGHERVFSGRNVLDHEGAFGRAHGKIGVIKNADPGKHPRMDVALKFHKQ